ncbi:sigma-70 family RNA polymerase sigma factor [Larkinella harenae]
MADRSLSDAGFDFQTDAELWRQFRDDDELAFGMLAERYYKRLYGYGSKFSKDREFIKDCIQDLFLDLWDKRHNLSVPDSVKLYLLISLRRRMQRKRSELKWMEEWEELPFESDLVGTSPIETAIIEDEASQYYIRKLQLLIPKLSRRQQEIIYLRFYENLDNQAIAELMSLSRQGVANLLWRTLRELKDYWYVGLNSLLILWMLLKP